MNVVFVAAARKSIRRSERGIVGMIIKDTVVPDGNPITIYKEKDIPEALSEENKEQIKLAMKGNDTTPRKIVVYVLAKTEEDYRKALEYFEIKKVTWLCCPTVKTDGQEEEIVEIDKDLICHTLQGKPIKPKTLGQKKYVDAIRNGMITFGLGPAGTGKTYLAMAMAITAFKNNEVSRIILTRPAIEAGEKLGFLPGDLQSKIDPYLRPLYDALYQIMGAESFIKNQEKGLIEVAPLAYMRGRTLDNAFIILDEAQNTTPAQMKMFLTRIGFGSKVVITGDSSQKDLPAGSVSGLDVAVKVVKDIEDISICTLTSKDVVRHPLVQRIVKAYEAYENKSTRSGKTNAKRRKS